MGITTFFMEVPNRVNSSHTIGNTALNSESINKLFAGIEGIELFDSPPNKAYAISTEEAWRRVSQIDLTPISKIDLASKEQNFESWFSKIASTNELSFDLAISFGGYGLMEWLQVKIEKNFESLAKLWLAVPDREIIVLDNFKELLIGFTSEEYSYNAYKIENVAVEN